jgi:nucleotide-binding universal stress UspA family protein
VSEHEEEPVSTILIGVDDSAHSEDAVAFGRRLAGATGGRVVVASAFPYNDFPSRAANLTYREALRGQAARTVRRMVQHLGLPDERVERIVTADMSPARALHAAAEQVDADLVVVGHTHHGHAGRVIPGATAERLLHGAPCPVAVVPDGYRNAAGSRIGRIGVAYIDTPEARAAVSAAAAVARALRARLEVITAVPYDPGYGVVGLVPDDLQAEMTERAEAELEAVVKALRPGIWAGAVRLDGDPAEQLAAHSAKLDLMIMGSRGYGPLRAVLAGGVSGRVSREAHCPVIVVPRGVATPLDGLFEQPVATTA